MSQNPEMPLPVNSTPSLTTCSNCHSAMPSELRFCRNCGFRLSDGLADYTETVRFGDQRGPLAPGAVSAPMPVRKRRKMSGMAWVFIALLVFFVGAAAFTALISPRRERVGIVQAPAKKSYVGVRDWTDVENGVGVSFEAATPPGGPADLAGLIGGDVITKFDGQRVNDEDDISKLMVNTPPGKTVDVEYIRDGETRVTKLTTMSEAEMNHLTRAFDDRPREARAQFGYNDDRVKRVELPGPKPGTKIFGVQLNEILNSRPADLAGVRNGDIVIAFDDIPIRTPDEFLMRVRRAVPYNTVNLTIMRGEEKLVIPVKMGRQ